MIGVGGAFAYSCGPVCPAAAVIRPEPGRTGRILCRIVMFVPVRTGQLTGSRLPFDR